MGKIDEDYSGTKAPNYDNFNDTLKVKKICKNCRHYHAFKLPFRWIDPFGACVYLKEITYPIGVCTEWQKKSLTKKK